MMNLNALKVDPEFQGKIPPLTFEELNQLEANILRDGRIINPIIVWEGLIVDGHNRFIIAKKHPEIPFTVHETEFANRYEAIIWICKNQLGRRNLTPEQKKYLIGKQYEAEKLNHGGDQKSNLKKSTGQNGQSIDKRWTRRRIADENGVNDSFVKRAEQFSKGVDTIVTRRAMNGGQDLPIICKVYEGLTEEEEAMLFSRQTGVSTPLTAGAELRAALVGKDPESLAFVKATESTGLQLGLDSYRAPWKIICIRTAFKEYKTYGADLYKEALTMLAKGWEGDPDSLRSGILQGMVRFVALYQGEYDPERLVKRLHTVHPMTLVNDEKSLSGTVSYKYMMLILRTYNGSSRSRSLPIKQ